MSPSDYVKSLEFLYLEKPRLISKLDKRWSREIKAMREKLLLLKAINYLRNGLKELGLESSSKELLSSNLFNAGSALVYGIRLLKDVYPRKSEEVRKDILRIEEEMAEHFELGRERFSAELPLYAKKVKECLRKKLDVLKEGLLAFQRANRIYRDSLLFLESCDKKILKALPRLRAI
jgi:hypothetical protein